MTSMHFKKSLMYGLAIILVFLLGYFAGRIQPSIERFLLADSVIDTALLASCEAARRDPNHAACQALKARVGVSKPAPAPPPAQPIGQPWWNGNEWVYPGGIRPA